ncbi:site-specific integrase [Acidithiobacillus ferriphilus]|uniref:site-specific integrase n=1 Tax=Acidithiobacillus ferriphilus TaxID=1689834 RepID=UPI001C07D430|nr:site-specific integrase [Acidithiobacillus ferriphilus]MBU2844642.1 site-specific integrase [Acidithiobacillus ferriphilus]
MATLTPRHDREDLLIGWQAKIRKKGYPVQNQTFRTKAEALEWATVVESEMVRGIWRNRVEAESTTLREALERYLVEVSPLKKSHKQESYRIIDWKQRPIAQRYLASIRGKDVADTVREMQSEGKSANTISLHLAILSHLFTIARKEWGMESLVNPVELVRKPKKPQGRDRRLVDDEEQRLLDACRATNPELAHIVTIAIETAMRQGEIIGMTWDLVDLKRQTVTLLTTKNGSKRIVPLSNTAVGTLQGMPRRMDGRVWTYTQDGLKSSWIKAVKRTAIDDLTFHDLRHEATSRLFEKGFNPMEVSSITGHKNMQMLKRYTHLKAEDLAKRMG